MFRSKAFLATLSGVSVAAVGLMTFAVLASTNGADLTISQKGRKFDPLSIDLAKGAAIVIVNDDGDLLHHAYVESEDFNFDSGDQQPGSRTRVVFSVAGDFKVLCGIHPKMKLAVHVR